MRAADLGTKVILEGTHKPKQVRAKMPTACCMHCLPQQSALCVCIYSAQIARKEGTDVVTDVDKAAEAAIVACVQAAFPNHAILGQELQQYVP